MAVEENAPDSDVKSMC